MHLGDPDLGCDLRLRHLLEESQLDDLALALVEGVESRRDEGAVLDLAVARVVDTELLGEAVVRALLEGAWSERVEYAFIESSASIASSSSTPAACASSAMVGERPSSVVSWSRTRRERRLSSLSRRGTCIAHALSRKCRRISPTIVGTA